MLILLKCIKAKFIVKNNYMLNLKTKIILEYLINECKDNSYHIIKSKDILSSLPKKYKIDFNALNESLYYLEKKDFISIKYNDNGLYCLAVLPNEYNFNTFSIKQKQENLKFSRLWIYLIFIFICCFVASLLGNLISYLFILH